MGHGMGEGSVDQEECEVMGVLGLLGHPWGVVGGVATFFTNQGGFTLCSLGVHVAKGVCLPVLLGVTEGGMGAVVSLCRPLYICCRPSSAVAAWKNAWFFFFTVARISALISVEY